MRSIVFLSISLAASTTVAQEITLDGLMSATIVRTSSKFVCKGKPDRSVKIDYRNLLDSQHMATIGHLSIAGVAVSQSELALVNRSLSAQSITGVTVLCGSSSVEIMLKTWDRSKEAFLTLRKAAGNKLEVVP